MILINKFRGKKIEFYLSFTKIRTLIIQIILHDADFGDDGFIFKDFESHFLKKIRQCFGAEELQMAVSPEYPRPLMHDPVDQRFNARNGNINKTGGFQNFPDL